MTKVATNDIQYYLDSEPDFTGRQLPPHLEGCEEFSAKGHDSLGREVVMYWIKDYDPEKELDDYDWSVADHVEYV